MKGTGAAGGGDGRARAPRGLALGAAMDRFAAQGGRSVESRRRPEMSATGFAIPGPAFVESGSTRKPEFFDRKALVFGQ